MFYQKYLAMSSNVPTVRALTLIGDILAQHDDFDLFADSLTSHCRQILHADCVP
jgi:hypothetical protein